MNKPELIECESCGTTDMDQDEILCEDCGEEQRTPWQPDPREDGGYFGWAGMTEA